MPATYRYDTTIIIVELVGHYSMEDFRKTVLDSLADPQCPKGSVLMINLGGSQSIYERSPDDVKSMAQFIASLGNRFQNRIAMVAPEDLMYGLMRMGSVGSDDRGIRSNVFRTLAEARTWLLA